MIIETESKAINEEASTSELGLFNAESKSSSDILTQARKSKQLSVEEVASELNLSTSVVRALESDNWEALPEATYVRGYVRSYANFLGLDVEEVLMNFRYKNSEADLNLDAMPKGISEPSMTSGIPKAIKRLIVVGALAAGTYFLFFDKIKTFINEKQLGVANVEVSESSVTTDNKKVENNKSTTASSVDAVNPQNSEVIVASDAAASVVAAELKDMLELSFSGISWVDISDSSGRKVIYKSFPPGEKIKVKAKKPLKVFIGNLAAVKMTYEGKGVPLSNFQEEDHAKFTLD